MVGQYHAGEANQWGELFELYPDYFTPMTRALSGAFRGVPVGANPGLLGCGLNRWSLFNLIRCGPSPVCGADAQAVVEVSVKFSLLFLPFW